jgi:Protein of unknwon function (DUF3008)
MEITNTDFDSIFEGIDLPEDFAAKLKTAFDEAVDKKINEMEATSKAQQGAAGAALSAKQGDTPVSKLKGASQQMYKTMSKKELKDMAGTKTKDLPMKVESSETIEELADVCEECGAEMEGTVCQACGWEAPMKEESEEIVRLESEDEMEDEEVMEQEENDLSPEQIQQLMTDIDLIKVVRSSGEESRTKFITSFVNSMRDLQGNTLAEPFVNFIGNLMGIIANDSTIANRISAEFKNNSNEQTPKTAADTESPENKQQVNAELEVYENVIESVDKYLTYVAESWIDENALAVEQGLKIEIMESFWNGLKTLYVENNIVLPEETNVVEDLKAKIADLEATISEEKQAFSDELTKQKAQYEEKLNEEINRSIEYKNNAEESTKKAIFESVSKDLSLTQKERFAKLVESVTYESKKSYEEKLKDIAKNAFDSSKTKKKLTEESMIEVSEDNTVVTDDPIMNLYSQAISKNLKF